MTNAMLHPRLLEEQYSGLRCLCGRGRYRLCVDRFGVRCDACGKDPLSHDDPPKPPAATREWDW